ncbi:ETHYLENE INSENSITIVE 3-like 1 protein [Dorcoceras hygrometricum]|uniref:ETHYLENE INSENSITIVE 3-like 1 protein n=1 Tax=Dorcoceras hygrometricum TaxID=472368 RepID=A0A2Z7B4U5_9LAMI|nr:ETHYLENE INSENSITIVE 3-like 1 protein [Dorcoceras hygrometricum]
MMTSAFLVKGAVTRIYDVSNISRQLSGISYDDVNSDVITISRWIKRSAKEKLLTDEKNKGEVEVAFSSKLQYIQSRSANKEISIEQQQSVVTEIEKQQLDEWKKTNWETRARRRRLDEEKSTDESISRRSTEAKTDVARRC